eukprot:CAMPEP_0167827036 /NCGR_PEP_ID=MMETSP0112_2-20121227/10443_1 /TAXON_ID=91324 /ORGANISM="Lotharella globosa, Strain CCCM811" /LENGTH=30 /DNA_ID= /DNA_START= /DNA_END= /DNA_ORIENTATION=
MPKDYGDVGWYVSSRVAAASLPNAEWRTIR